MSIFKRIFNRNNSTKSVTSIPKRWSILKGENEGNLMLIRKNVGLDKIAGKENYSTNCGIAFKFLFPDENGLPDIENEPELDDLEDDIFEIYETDLNSIVSIIITTSGFREFVLYTKDVEEFYVRLNKLKEKYHQYEFTSYKQSDENWGTYKSFK